MLLGDTRAAASLLILESLCCALAAEMERSKRSYLHWYDQSGWQNENEEMVFLCSKKKEIPRVSH